MIPFTLYHWKPFISNHMGGFLKCSPKIKITHSRRPNNGVGNQCGIITNLFSIPRHEENKQERNI